MSSSESKEIFIGGFCSGRATVRELEEYFSDFGRIRNYTFKGSFAFIEYSKREEAEKAVSKMNQKDYYGKTITVNFARKYTHTHSETQFSIEICRTERKLEER